MGTAGEVAQREMAGAEELQQPQASEDEGEKGQNLSGTAKVKSTGQILQLTFNSKSRPYTSKWFNQEHKHPRIKGTL